MQGLLEQPVDAVVLDGDRDPLLLQVGVELVHEEPRDAREVLVGQRVEDDDLVHPVDELGVEGAFHLAHHHLVDALGGVLGLAGGEAHAPLLLDEPGADVGGHDDDRVLEVDGVAEAVGEVPVLEHLEEHVEDVGVGLLDLVEEHHRVGVPLHALGELAPLLVPDVAGGRADQLGDRVLLHVLGHVEADERPLAPEQERGQAARDLGLPHPRRTEEHERADRPVRVLEAGPRATDGAGDGADRALLGDDPPVQLLLHAQELGRLLLLDRGDGDARPLRHHVVDVALGDGVRARAAHVPVLADDLEVLALRDLLVPEERAAEALAPVHDHAYLARELRRLLQGRRVTELHPAPRLVEEVDGLVGQEAVGDIAARLVDGGFEGGVLVRDVVELLVAVLDPAQDLDRLLLGRGGDLHRLEAPLQRAVLLDVLPVLGGGGGPDALDLAAGQRGLEDVGGVERALGRAGAHQGVELVDEDHDVVALGQLPHDRLEPLLELAAVLGPRHDERDVEGKDPLLGQVDGHVALDDFIGEPLDQGRFAYTGLANKDRVVAGTAAEDLDDTGQLVVAPDERVEGPAGGGLGQVARELREERGLLGLPDVRLLVQELDDVLPDRGEAHALLGEDGGGDALLLPHEAEEDVLGADVVVEHPLRLLGGVAERALALGGERDVDGGRHLVAVERPALDLLADGLHREVALGEDAGGQPLALADEAEEEVLRLDRVAAQLAGFVAGEEDHPTGTLRITFKHLASGPPDRF